MEKKRAVCLNCIDGRVQLPVIQWIKDNHQVDYVDMITEPGMDGLLAGAESNVSETIKKLKLSIEVNKASPVFVAGHHDCKGNPVDDTTHKNHIRTALSRIKDEISATPVLGLWVDKEFQCEEVR